MSILKGFSRQARFLSFPFPNHFWKMDMGNRTLQLSPWLKEKTTTTTNKQVILKTWKQIRSSELFACFSLANSKVFLVGCSEVEVWVIAFWLLAFYGLCCFFSSVIWGTYYLFRILFKFLNLVKKVFNNFAFVCFPSSDSICHTSMRMENFLSVLSSLPCSLLILANAATSPRNTLLGLKYHCNKDTSS